MQEIGTMYVGGKQILYLGINVCHHSAKLRDFKHGPFIFYPHPSHIYSLYMLVSYLLWVILNLTILYSFIKISGNYMYSKLLERVISRRQKLPLEWKIKCYSFQIIHTLPYTHRCDVLFILLHYYKRSRVRISSVVQCARLLCR